MSGKQESIGISDLKDEHFLNTLQSTVSEMADKYKDRLFDYARNRNPENYEQFNQTENRINKYWDDGDFEDFQRELWNWKVIYADLLKLFSGCKDDECNR